MEGMFTVGMTPPPGLIVSCRVKSPPLVSTSFQKHIRSVDSLISVTEFKFFAELRMNARSSLGKQVRANHEHDFEGEEYDEDRDVYRKKCKTCDHVTEYEKM
jgi:hypothetical protein